MNKKIWCVAQMTTNEPRWQIIPTWLGWSRIIGFAILTNIKRPALLIFMLGWQIHMGRLPVTQTTTTEIKQ